MKATQLVHPATSKPVKFDPPARVQQRALSRYYWESPTGCRISTYSSGSHGYAQIGWQDAGKVHMGLCHRVVWVAVYGPISDGMTVDHLCKNRKCINIEHLRLLDNYENARRTFGRNWRLGECANGHPDTYLHQEPSGRVRCSACAAQYQRDYRARKRAA